MDKQVIFAVAGSGKTTHILNKLDLEKKSLIITYTNENLKSLERGIEKKFKGIIPQNITLMTYFTFLYSFSFITFMGYKLKPRGIYYETPPVVTNTIARNKLKHYMSSNRYMYHNRLAKLLVKYKITLKINKRIEKYFDNLFIDEVQDFASNDFNLILEISKANINMLFVGDFYQHTYKTSSDGNIRKNLHKDYDKYLEEFKKVGIIPDTVILNKSYRCSPSVCNFISKKTNIKIESHRSDETEVQFIEDQKKADQLFKDDNVIKLFLQDSDKYICHSKNWAKSKGLNDYNDVVVVLYKTALDLYLKNDLKNLASLSKNSLYVACSRAKGNLYLVPYNLYKKKK